MQKQVDKSHYQFDKYIHKLRWASLWHQIDEVAKLSPQSVLEIGPGPGLFKATACAIGLSVETLDLDPELRPDYVASVLDMPFKNGEFDVVCAFQMLEHLPFEDSLAAFCEMARVANKAVVISLPDAATRWPFSVYIPKFGAMYFSVPKPCLLPRVHRFDGEHHWEINKVGFSLKKITKDFLNAATSVRLSKTYRVEQNPYHRFFVFEK